MATVYLSPDPYFNAFEQLLDLRKFVPSKHPIAGLELCESNGCLHLQLMCPGTPAAKTLDWQSHL